MWARIDKGVVREVTEVDPTGRFAPELEWVECPEGTEEPDTFDGEKFSKPVISEVESGSVTSQVTPEPRVGSIVDQIIEDPAQLARLKTALGL